MEFRTFLHVNSEMEFRTFWHVNSEMDFFSKKLDKKKKHKILWVFIEKKHKIFRVFIEKNPKFFLWVFIIIIVGVFRSVNKRPKKDPNFSLKIEKKNQLMIAQ